MEICILSFIAGCIVMGIGLLFAIVFDNIFDKLENNFFKVFKYVLKK